MPIHVVEGERGLAKDNIQLGKIILKKLPYLPRGVPRIDVKFEIDASGTLVVTAEYARNRRLKEELRVERLFGNDTSERKQLVENSVKEA